MRQLFFDKHSYVYFLRFDAIWRYKFDKKGKETENTSSSLRIQFSFIASSYRS